MSINISPLSSSFFSCTPRVLIIEEHPIIRQLAHSMCELLGAKCTSTAESDKALDFFQQGYDLVLVDLGLSHVSGFELVQRMRELEVEGGHTPIIGHATVANPEEVEPLCLSLGMDAVCPKLTSVQEMFELLTRWLGRPLVMPVHLLDVHIPAVR